MTEVPGLYGKLPARGDFVRRGSLPGDFLENWDGWLQEVLPRSREQLGGDWLRAYLNSPVWRFVLTAGCCGALPVAGLVMPSVDRVGRYFPLTLALALPRTIDAGALTRVGADWFEQAERLLLEALDDDLDLDDFVARIEGLGAPPCPEAPPEIDGERWYCELDSPDRVGDGLLRLQSLLLTRVFPRCSLWWTHGSHQIEPCLLINPGLLPAQAFSALLVGDWTRHGWAMPGTSASGTPTAGLP